MKKPQPKSTDRSTGAAAAPATLVRVPFRGGHLTAAQLDGEVWVPLPLLCDALGLLVHGQVAKLRAKPWATTQTVCGVAADGRAREMVCLDLRSLPLWLATIEPSRVKPEAREALVAYQREAADVLARHFMPQPAANDAPEVSPEMFATMVTLLGALRDEVAILRAERLAPVGVLGKNKAEAWVKRPIRALAKQTAPLEGEPHKNQRTRLENALRFTINFFGPWDAMPETTLPAVQRHLFEVERQMLRRMTRRGRGLAKTWPGQLPLDLRAQQAKAN